MYGHYTSFILLVQAREGFRKNTHLQKQIQSLDNRLERTTAERDTLILQLKDAHANIQEHVISDKQQKALQDSLVAEKQICASNNEKHRTRAADLQRDLQHCAAATRVCSVPAGSGSGL